MRRGGRKKNEAPAEFIAEAALIPAGQTFFSGLNVQSSLYIRRDWLRSGPKPNRKQGFFFGLLLYWACRGYLNQRLELGEVLRRIAKLIHQYGR